jgi:formate hydrogenlyase subunit 6/NADH:ubiquinone oxidoreductase subunit I
MSMFSFAKTEFKNLFSKPATRMYPQQPREYSARTRGHIENDMDVCILCGLCSRKCPTGAIKVDRTGKTWSISRFSCIQCGYCAESCPKKCLSMEQSYTQPDGEKTIDVLTKPEQPVSAPPKPAAGAPKAAAPKPAAVPKASAEASKPVKAETKPAADASKPAKAEAKPASDASKPAKAEAKPANDASKPA